MRLRVDCVDESSMYFVPQELEKTPAQRQVDRGIYDVGTGTRTRLRESARYNCYGLVLGKRKGWLEDDSDLAIRRSLAADGYRRTGEPASLIAGDVVIYTRGHQIDHMGLIIGIHTTLSDNKIGVAPDGRDKLVVSKFGDAGEYIHAMYDVPDRYGPPSEFWTLRFP